MKKKEIIILAILVVSLITVSLYQTLATDITMNKTNGTNADLSFTFDITDQTGRVVNVKAGATKILDVFVTNSNDGTIKYGIAYTPSTVKTDDITIAQLNTSKDSVSGLINKNERKQITLIIINNSTNDITLSLVTVTGYEHGGDLIVPSNHTLITETSESYSVSLFVTNGTITGGNTLTNLIKNGSYESGSDNWNLTNASVTSSKASHGGNSLMLKANTTAMSTQILSEKSPILGHKYYGRLKFLSTTNFTTLDNRFEWYYTDGANALMVFANKNVQTTNWTLLSNIGSISVNTYLSNTWNIRNFEVNANADSYVDELVMIDLTESYGSGNEPSKEWLDTNIQYFEETASQLTEETIKGGEVSFEITPDSGYVIDTINCDGGNYNEDTNTLTLSNVTSNKSCFISFKRDVVYASEYIESLLVSNPETMNNDDPDGNVRYMGADPNNYVSFNNELWRIIGVFNVASTVGAPTEKRLKIIRDESLGNMVWNSGNVNDWTQASLQKYLNGDYYNSIDSISQSLIGDTYWNLGGTASYTSASNGLASHWYRYERGTTVYSGRPTYWVGKIGLMYPSDYGYATSGGTTTNRASCLAKEMLSWNSYSDCKNNDYLYNSSSYEWTLTPCSSSSNGVFFVDDSGFVHFSNGADYSDGSASPVFYLKSTVEITGGDGTSSSPYTLG